MTIEVGSIVRLKSGSPDMTVVMTTPAGMVPHPPNATCTWFDKAVPCTITVPCSCLDETPREGKPFYTAREVMDLLESDRMNRIARGEAA